MPTSTTTITNMVSETMKLTPSSILSLFVLDATNIGASTPVYFHNGSNGVYTAIIFNGIAYTAFPIEVQDFDIDGKGQLPRPKIRAANIQGAISSLLVGFDDLVGSKVIRRRVFAKFLDATNFPNNINPFGIPDPSGSFPDEVFYIDSKTAENRSYVEWEMVTPLEAPQARLPNRIMIANQCTWKYRGAGTCGYAGLPVADYANKNFTTTAPAGYGFTLNNMGQWNAGTSYNQGDYVYIVSTLDFSAGDKFYYVCKTSGTIGIPPNSSLGISVSPWVADSCSKLVTGCVCRFSSPLPFGGFQGITRAPFAS